MIKILFIALLCFHGIIHLMGFAKAFGFANMEALTKEIYKGQGVWWLVACILFLLAAGYYGFSKYNWCVFALLAVGISQYLIISSWQDARFGTIANIIIFVITLIGFSSWNFHKQFESDYKMKLNAENQKASELLLEKDLLGLPVLIQNYLRQAGVVGKPKVQHFKIEFEGKIRKDEQSEWMPFKSVQYNFMDTPARLFFMNATMKGLPVAGYHAYKNGKAFMDIRLFSILKVQYQDGTEMDLAETVTFFNDMCCMAPATLIDKRIQWTPMDDHHVKASFINNGLIISAELEFNHQGQLVNFSSNDRYAADAGKRLPWSTPLKEYKLFKGYSISSSADAIYTYPQGTLTYGTFQLVNLEYNGN
jgi:hypothetical protein